LAVRTPLPLTEQAGSPDVSMTIVPGAAVIVHPVLLDEKPVPDTVTSVAGRAPTGGEPIAGFSVTAAVTVNDVDAVSP